MPILTSVESDENKGLLRLLKTKKLENYYSKEVQNTKPEYVLDDTFTTYWKSYVFQPLLQ